MPGALVKPARSVLGSHRRYRLAARVGPHRIPRGDSRSARARVTTPDPNNTIRVGGQSMAFGDDGAALYDVTDISAQSVLTSADVSLTTEDSAILAGYIAADTSLASRLSVADSTVLVATDSLDTSLASRLSVADSVVTVAFVSADTSMASRLSVADSTVLVSAVSADTSLYARLSTADATFTSQVASLSLRVSVAESTEANIH